MVEPTPLSADPITFDAAVCGDPAWALEREWLETNGLGGFASSTILGLNTRRYHGLLVAALSPPTGRTLLLSKLEETLVVDGERFDLSANEYPGAIHPQGYQHLESFRLDPYPIFRYRIGEVTLEKSVCMLYGENTTVVRYRLLGAPAGATSVVLELYPLVAFRDYHALTHENPALDPSCRREGDALLFAPYHDLPTLFLNHSAAAVENTGCWYRTFEYARERERGLDFQEDLFNPSVLRFDLARGEAPAVVASLGAKDAANAEELLAAERARRAALAPAGAAPLTAALVRAADQFLVRRGGGRTVIAGYPWFTDWGRDTMISLPGLIRARGADAARSVLLAFAAHVDQGMLPNRFPDRGEEPEYNTVDASLWYFEAVRALLQATGDHAFVREHLYPVLTDIVAWHERGTRYGIRADSDGLLLSGEPGVQLTWMDAKVGDWVVTPRRGKPVEIQALWYHALRVLEDLARLGDDAATQRRCASLANRAKRAFEPLFWNEAAGCLHDNVENGVPDPSIRPNQVLAASLAHTMLGREKALRMLATVEQHLLTPYGLRTLSPTDPAYVGRYEGGPLERDGTYHQGTVWPWLLGPFLTAYLRAHRRSPRARAQAARWLGAFPAHLREAGLGQVSEIFDGDSPHTPRGCPAQAWSVAEVARVLLEELPGVSSA